MKGRGYDARAMSAFAGGEGLDRQSVNRAGQFLGEGGMNLSLPLNATLARKGVRGDLDGEMALATRPRARMPGVLGAVVDHIQLHRIEAGLQFLSDRFSNIGHIVSSILERKNFYLIIGP